MTVPLISLGGQVPPDAQRIRAVEGPYSRNGQMTDDTHAPLAVAGPYPATTGHTPANSQLPSAGGGGPNSLGGHRGAVAHFGCAAEGPKLHPDQLASDAQVRRVGVVLNSRSGHCPPGAHTANAVAGPASPRPTKFSSMPSGVTSGAVSPNSEPTREVTSPISLSSARSLTPRLASQQATPIDAPAAGVPFIRDDQTTTDARSRCVITEQFPRPAKRQAIPRLAPPVGVQISGSDHGRAGTHTPLVAAAPNPPAPASPSAITILAPLVLATHTPQPAIAWSMPICVAPVGVPFSGIDQRLPDTHRRRVAAALTNPTSPARAGQKRFDAHDCHAGLGCPTRRGSRQ